MLPRPDPAHLAPRLLRWFCRAKRDLPWRRSREPYHILVSEIMLQQTQVDRVIPFFERFLKAFPTPRALAAAPLDDVLRLWSGLGYYSRARSIHAAARAIVSHHAGRLPDTYADLLALPGVGEYTAGAIASIAFGLRHPAIDANARRLLARVFRLDAGRPRDRREIDRLGALAVPARRPGDYNQALMEHGSLVCTPRSPDCPNCCLRDICLTHIIGTPKKKTTSRRPKTRTTRAALALVRRRGRYLIAQRPLTGVWAGLWEFPNCEVGAGEDPETALLTLLLSDFGLDTIVGPELTSLTHGIMSRRIHLTAYTCAAPRGRTKARRHPAIRWVAPEDLADYALPAPHRRVASVL